MIIKIELLDCDVTDDIVLGPIISLTGILGFYICLFYIQEISQLVMDSMSVIGQLVLIFMLVLLILALMPIPRWNIKEFIREHENDRERYTISKR